MLGLDPLRGLVVIDEVQHLPGLFPVLRVLADRPRATARFLLLGSASFDLVRHGSETLAGRVGFHELPGFSLAEVAPAPAELLWLRGGFPRAFLARSEKQSAGWRRDFIKTFLQRDLPLFGGSMPPAAMGRFWTMLAHWHGQVWNGSEFGRAFGISHTAVRKYLDLLSGTFMVRQLPPWTVNVGKRVVKSPKVYINDSGLLHILLGLDTLDSLLAHPKVGASWEGFLLSTVISLLGAREEECFFWATHGGAELDLLVVRGSRRVGFEFKRSSAPKITPSIRAALEDLELQKLTVVHAGEDSFPLAPRVRAVAARDILSEIKPLK
jgi:predicted AAA+ superfamily ATPase